MPAEHISTKAGTIPLFNPTACKVTQPCCDADSPDQVRQRTQCLKLGGSIAENRLTVEPSCKDEARVGQQGTLTRIWARRGARPRALRDRRFNWAYLFGAICPAPWCWRRLGLAYRQRRSIWEYLRGNTLSHQVWETYEEIVDACCNAWNALMRAPDIIRSIATREWAQVKT